MFKTSLLVLALCCVWHSTKAAINIQRDNILAQANGGGIWETDLNTTVQWAPYDNNGTMMQQYTLQGPDTGYVAMAISTDTKMGPTDDCYYCSRTSPSSTNVTITSAYLAGRGPPGVVGLVGSSHVISAAIANGMITCSFLRPISVTKNVSGTVTTWDVSQNMYNLLFAYGAVHDDGRLANHQTSGRTFTNGTFDLLNNTNYRQTAQEMTTSEMTTSSTAAVSSTLAVITAALIFSMF